MELKEIQIIVPTKSEYDDYSCFEKKVFLDTLHGFIINEKKKNKIDCDKCEKKEFCRPQWTKKEFWG